MPDWRVRQVFSLLPLLCFRARTQADKLKPVLLRRETRSQPAQLEIRMVERYAFQHEAAVGIAWRARLWNLRGGADANFPSIIFQDPRA